jgi:hypothetical protein
MVLSCSATVPCPERDLVVDTGLTSRRVLREALAQLEADGWLVLRRSFDPTSDAPEARSHHVSLPELIPEHPTPVALPSPPSSFTPLPLGVRASLGPELWHAWLTLRTDSPTTLAGLVSAMGSPSEPEPSRDQLSTLAGRLQRLAVLGLAVCDEYGSWVRVNQISLELLERARESLARRTATVAVERSAYALVRAGRGRWVRDRELAIARWQTGRHIAARQWFDALPAAEQHRRRSAYQSRFAALPIARQRQVKDELARRRVSVGAISEDAVRRAWINSMSPEQFTARVIDRILAFRALPPPLQTAKAASWAEHRVQWGISRDPRILPRPVRVPSPTDTDEVLEQLDLLVLIETLDRDPNYELVGLPQPGASDHKMLA